MMRNYDAVGRVTSMTDYHSNVTSYAYTNLNQLDTITAPGNRVWDFDYNANGFPVAYTHPNGMLTEYEYDNVFFVLRLIDECQKA